MILSQKHILGVKKVVWDGLDVVWGGLEVVWGGLEVVWGGLVVVIFRVILDRLRCVQSAILKMVEIRILLRYLSL